MSTELRVISRHTVTDFEALDVLHILSACNPHDGCYTGYTYLALGSNNTDGLVARNQGELGNELAFVDVLGSMSAWSRSPAGTSKTSWTRISYQICRRTGKVSNSYSAQLRNPEVPQ